MVAAEVVRSSDAVLAYAGASDALTRQCANARLDHARERLRAHTRTLAACELEPENDARVRALLGQLLLEDLARFDAVETRKRSAAQKLSKITSGKMLVSRTGECFVTKHDHKDVVVTAVAIHEAVQCASGSGCRGRNQTWNRLLKTVRAVWGGKLWEHITKQVLQAHRLDEYVLAKLMDQHPHALNSTALSIMHEAEGCAKGVAGLIPSASSISRVLKQIDEAYGLPEYMNITAVSSSARTRAHVQQGCSSRTLGAPAHIAPQSRCSRAPSRHRDTRGALATRCAQDDLLSVAFSCGVRTGYD